MWDAGLVMNNKDSCSLRADCERYRVDLEGHPAMYINVARKTSVQPASRQYRRYR